MSQRHSRSMLRPLTLLALFTAASLVLTAVVVASLLDLDTAARHTYRAEFTDASVLQNGDPVRIAGVQVGKVSAVRLHGSTAVVTFTVDAAQRLTTATRAQIQYENLFGQRNLTLSPGPAPSGAPLTAGATIPLARTSPALDLTALFNGFQPLFAALTPNQINDLSGNIIAAFQGQGSTIASLVAQTAQLTNNLADRQQVLDSVVGNLTTVLQTLGAHDTQVGAFIDNFAGLASTLAGERGDISNALTSSSQLVGQLSGLLGNLQPSFEATVHDLVGVTGSLATSQNALDGLITVTPKTAATLSSALDDGSFSKTYLCDVISNPDPPLSLSPVQLPAAVQTLLAGVGNALSTLDPSQSNTTSGVATIRVNLPSGQLGDPSLGTKDCGK